MMSVLLGKPLVLHEQNSVAGMANKVLAGWQTVCSPPSPRAEEGAMGGQPAAHGVHAAAGAGCPLCRPQRPLRLLVVGGSLGAKALNEVVPKALALIPLEAGRPQVVHQSGARQIDELRAGTPLAGVAAELTPFIDDTAQAFAEPTW
jgi:UDP-N-acetylglucosamine--N-acetylmuramyl-(pentapeptide) pyrophosphoryl-undecaprenol N-acetylglucosamine transferase